MGFSIESAMASVLVGQEDRYPGFQEIPGPEPEPVTEPLSVDYPKMLYKHEHRPLVVGDQEQEKSARADGWGDLPVSPSPGPVPAPVARPATVRMPRAGG